MRAGESETSAYVWFTVPSYSSEQPLARSLARSIQPVFSPQFQEMGEVWLAECIAAVSGRMSRPDKRHTPLYETLPQSKGKEFIVFLDWIR